MMRLNFYNTLTKAKDGLSPNNGVQVRMYSCGPTVYNVVHLGNLRSFLTADVIQRTIRVIGGYPVLWVMNITDIDDKTIRDSATGSGAWLSEMGVQTTDPMENLRLFTAYYIRQFHATLSQFGIDITDFYAQPRATDYIEPMQQMVREIHKAGFAYVREGSVYFDVNAYSREHEYGQLYTIDRENFKEGVCIDADEYDRDSVSDFVLWKAHKPGEPAWDFVWADGTNLRGRPGWHLECSAMSKEIFKTLPFDIHTGGVDLRFPHHEDELAQCCAAHYGTGETPQPFTGQSAFWIHNEFLEVEGRKMSKSAGNYYTLQDLIKKGYNPLDVRYAMLGAHYRSVYNFTVEGLKGASAARKRIQEYIWDLLDCAGIAELPPEKAGIAETNPLEGVLNALADDIHTPRALAELHQFIGSHPATGVAPQQALSILSALSLVNGVFNVWTFQGRPTVNIPQEVINLAEQRLKARAAKDWTASDVLRDAISAMGWTVLDTRDGYKLEPFNE